MEIIKGKYNRIKFFSSVIDQTTRAQIQELANQPFTKNTQISIMADCHAGKGCVIGTTMKIIDRVVPNLVGVDIGCGMLTVKLPIKEIDYIKLDRFIRKKIPSDMAVYQEEQVIQTKIENLHCYIKLKGIDRINRSIGTLGGGNHFIEIDSSTSGDLYLIIHTGSRNLGKQVAELYQRLAITDWHEKKKGAINRLIQRYKKLDKEDKIQQGLQRLEKRYAIDEDLIPLEKENFKKYIDDMKIAQEFAVENREAIAKKIVAQLGYSLEDLSYFHTVHNYIHMQDMILRKGAISAYEGEMVLIPINMRDGSILAVGKANAEYNYSAPHGAGRVLSRTDAKKTISLEDFKASMNGIYSTSVAIDTLDESPFAYKGIEDIIPNILPTVDIIDILKPVYNFKACKRRGRD